MKYLFIIALVAVSLRLSAQVETTEARQNNNGQINAATSFKDVKVHGKTKAGEEGRITTRSSASTPGNRTGSRSSMGGKATNTKSLQKGKPHNTNDTNVTHTGPSKNANNKNGTKTNSSTTTSGSGKKDN